MKLSSLPLYLRAIIVVHGVIQYIHIHTLYKPLKPSSLMTATAPILVPSVISPATCNLILTISSGLVNNTSLAPPYKM